MFIPTFDASAMAVDVLDNVCFYEDEMFHQRCSQQRETVQQMMTIEQVYLQFTKEYPNDPERGLLDLCLAIGTLMEPLLKYFQGITIRVEDIPHYQQRIALTSPKDVEIFHATASATLPTSKDVFKTTMSKLNTQTNTLTTRANDLALVLGSSGSGKTFFALACQDGCLAYLS